MALCIDRLCTTCHVEEKRMRGAASAAQPDSGSGANIEGSSGRQLLDVIQWVGACRMRSSSADGGVAFSKGNIEEEEEDEEINSGGEMLFVSRPYHLVLLRVRQGERLELLRVITPLQQGASDYLALTSAFQSVLQLPPSKAFTAASRPINVADLPIVVQDLRHALIGRVANVGEWIGLLVQPSSKPVIGTSLHGLICRSIDRSIN
jgi:hypothetical protein